MLNKTPPWLVPSPGEKGGGLGVRLVTSPCKTSACYRNMTCTRMNQVSSALGRGEPPQRRQMTPCGESQMTLEATRPKTLLIQRATRMGTWNVRTMYETGKAFQIAAEMRAYNLALLGISETRWTQPGRKKLNSGELLLYSGHKEGHLELQRSDTSD